MFEPPTRLVNELQEHSQESTQTTGEMRPYFNQLLIPFQLLSSMAHIISFSITV